MTPLEALVAFYTLRKNYLHLLLETGQIDREDQENITSWEMLNTLTEVVLGPRAPGQLPFLCAVCLSQYAVFYVQEKGEDGPTWGCNPCLNRLRAEGKIVAGVQG